MGDNIPGDKRDWVERTNTAFSEPYQIDVDARIISVEINNPDTSVTTSTDGTERRFDLQATRVPKQTVVRLLINGTDDHLTEGETRATADTENDDRYSEAPQADEAEGRETADTGEPTPDGMETPAAVDAIGET